MKIIPLQQPFRPVLSTVIGNVDYTRFKEQLERIEAIILSSGVEQDFIKRSVKQYLAASRSAGIKKVSSSSILKHEEKSITALRCVILMSMLNETNRGMSRRLAECPLFRQFCQLEQLGDEEIRVPGKSSIQEFMQWLPEEELRGIVGTLLHAAAKGASVLELKNDVELEQVWVDCSCVQANIHFPVDWVLLRDGVRTLMKATELIRKHGLKSRMAEPKKFLSAINSLCMQMALSRRRVDSKRQRKKVLRSMKKLVKVVKAHAKRHRDLLNNEWKSTDWTGKQAEQVLRRIDGVLAQLPLAEKQAHERIIGERQVENAEKILSLYEREINVIVRGKSEAEVEFGNTLLISEQKNGLLVDWRLFEGSAPADSKLLKASILRTEEFTGRKIKAVTTDRGFDSPANVAFLKQENIYDGVCPKSPSALAERLQEQDFMRTQKRRASTEARIGIFKNSFLGGLLRVKGFRNRNTAIAWHVLTHNLWVLARIPVAEEKQLAKAA